MADHRISSLGPFMRVGVVGCGRVGRTVVFAIDSGRVHADLAAICDTNADRVQDLIFQLKRPTRSMSLHGLVASVDLMIEATNRHVAPAIIMAALDGGKDVLVTSTAAILARDDFARIANDRGLTIFAANTLLTGVDALNAAPAAAARVTLTITCPPVVLEDAPFLRGRELKATERPQIVFQGDASDALAAFPALANIIAAATIGAGGAELLVRIRAHHNTDVTEIELVAATEKQRTEERARVAVAGREPVDPESVGLLAIGFLRSLVSSVRLV
jgi:aspartate dehydrogenase